MSDIFNMIKANIERSNKDRNVNAERFLRGNEEQRYIKRKAEKENMENIQNDELDEEVGLTKDKKDYKSKVEILNIKELSKLAPEKQNRLLIKGYLELFDAFEDIQSEVKDLEDDLGNKSLELHTVKRDNNKLKDLIRIIAGILPDGARLKERLDTSYWQVHEIEPEIVGKIQNLANRVLSMEEYIEHETESVTNENKSLKRQLIKFEAELAKIEQYLDEVENNPQPVSAPAPAIETKKTEKVEKNEEEVKEEKIEVKKPMQRPSFKVDEPDDAPAAVEEDDDDDIVVVEVDRYVETLSSAHKDIIQIIGETGVSRNAELKPHLEKKYKSQDISQTVKSLREGGFLDAEQVKLGSRGGYNFTVYELSKLGKAIYKNISGKKAVVSEKKLVLNQHKSLEHGYLIKESSILFEEMGYKVFTDRKELRFDLPNGKRKDFDLIIEKDGEKCHIEVERGTHVDEDFFDAMDKIYQVMDNLGENPIPFYFVAPNEQVLYGKTKRQFFMWINKRMGGMDQVKGKLVAHFAKFESIKKKGKNVWETIKF